MAVPHRTAEAVLEVWQRECRGALSVLTIEARGCWQVSGFPTIAWVDGKGGGITVYSGDRSLEDLKTFVTLKSKYKDGKDVAGEEPAKDEL